MPRVAGKRETLAGHDGVWLTHAEAVLALRWPGANERGDLEPIKAGRLEEGATLVTTDLYEAPSQYVEVFLIDQSHDRYYLTPTVKP